MPDCVTFSPQLGPSNVNLLQIDIVNPGTTDCGDLLASKDFELRLAESSQCLLGQLTSGASYDVFDLPKDACWSVATIDDFIQFSTSLFLFDMRSANDIRPWSPVPLRCDIGTAVIVNPVTLRLSESAFNAVGTTASTPSELDLKVSPNSSRRV